MSPVAPRSDSSHIVKRGTASVLPIASSIVETAESATSGSTLPTARRIDGSSDVTLSDPRTMNEVVPLTNCVAG